MKLLSALLRGLAFVCLSWLCHPAMAEGSYVSAKCASGCSYSQGSRTTDTSVALYAGAPAGHVCNKPATVIYGVGAVGSPTYVAEGTLADVGDPNGTSYLLPTTYTGCDWVGNDPAGTPGVFHTGQFKSWAITHCNAGYAPGRMFSNWPIACLPSAASTAPADAANDQGAPPDCDPCREAFLTSVAPNAGSNKTFAGDPVNMANGNELFTEDDYTPSGSSLVALSRYYNSGTPAGTSHFGPGWSHSFRYQALVGDGTGSSVALVRPDGSSILFVYDQATSQYVGPRNETGRLTAVLSSGQLSSLTYTRADGTQEQYTGYNSSCFGCLTKIVYRQGGQVTASLSDTGIVADNRGHTLQFAYQSIAGAVRFSKVTLPGGAYISYGYSSQGVLTSATYPDGSQRRYEYAGTTSRPLLTKVYDGNGAAFATITYDSLGRATSTKHGSNAELTTFTYSGGSTTVTNSLGYTKTVSFDAPSNKARAQAQVVQTSCPNQSCAAKQDSFGYDSAGNLAYIVDAVGVKTCLSFDTVRSLPLRAVEGLPSGADCGAAIASPPAGARTRTWQWHATYPFPMVEAGPQYKVLYNYDTAGRKLTQAEVETSDASGASGTSASGTGNTRTTTWTYDSQGSVLTVKAPRTDVNATTTFGYDGNQNLVSVTSPVGLVTTLGNYDAHGRPGLVAAPTGLQTALTYDARGRIVQVVNGAATTAYGYSPAGLLTSVTLPTGVVLSLAYDDAHRLVTLQDSLGNRSDRVLDTEGNVLQETVTGNGGSVALATQAAYDQLSRLTAISKPQ